MSEPAATAPTEVAERFLPDEMSGELIEAEHVARYLWASRLAAGLDVLDAGCGDGYGSALLARAGARRCVGIDISRDAVAAAHARYASDNLEFVTADILRLPFPDDSFDLVACFEVIEHLSDQADVISELHRVLKPRGRLAISSPNEPEYPSGNPFHERELSADEFGELLRHRFDYVSLVRQHNWLASAILTDEDFEHSSREKPLHVESFKLASREANRELYTLALCSDSDSAVDTQILTLTHPIEVVRWLGQIEDLKTELARVKQELNDKHAELLSQVEAAEAARQEALERGDELHQALTALASAERMLVETRAAASRAYGELEARAARFERRAYWLDRLGIDLEAWAGRPAARFVWRTFVLAKAARRRLR